MWATVRTDGSSGCGRRLNFKRFLGLGLKYSLLGPVGDRGVSQKERRVSFFPLLFSTRNNTKIMVARQAKWRPMFPVQKPVKNRVLSSFSLLYKERIYVAENSDGCYLWFCEILGMWLLVNPKRVGQDRRCPKVYLQRKQGHK